MRTDAENRSKILGAIRDMSRSQVELHKILAAHGDLGQSSTHSESLFDLMNNAKLLVQDAKDKLNIVKFREGS